MSMHIEDVAGLSSTQQRVFRRLCRIVASPSVDADYDRLDGAKHGKVVSVDVARHLAREFGSWGGRLLHTRSTANPAGAYALDRLKREIQSGTGKMRRLLVTAGGAGSGKTSQLKGATQVADLVYDNQLRSFSRAAGILAMAQSHGWQVEVVYVCRPFADVVRAVIERSQRTGRWNRLAELPAAHTEAQATIVKLSRRFKRHAWIHAVYNASPGRGDREAGARVFMRELRKGGHYHLGSTDELLQTIPGILGKALSQGVVCEEVAAVIGQGLPPDQSHRRRVR